MPYLTESASTDEICKTLLAGSDDTNRKLRLSQVVGPHGSGKTTLTVAIAERLMSQGIGTNWLTIRGRSVPVVKFDNYLQAPCSSDPSQTLLVIDGIESVNRLQRLCLHAQLRKRYWQIVITTHRVMKRVPVLARLEPSFALFQRLCYRLLSDSGEQEYQWDHPIENAFRHAKGNIREAFFELYDQFESRRGEIAVNEVLDSAP